jgi:hypothetical protein
MVRRTKNRKSAGSKKRFIGKPNGLIQQRVQDIGPEHFGIVAVDCAKRRSKWMLCDFYGKVIIEPTSVEHAKGGLRTMVPGCRGSLQVGRVDRLDHRHNLVKQRARLMVQIRRLLHQTMPGFADLFVDDKLFNKSITPTVRWSDSATESCVPRRCSWPKT